MPRAGSLTRERILEIALDLFTDRGFAATGTRDITNALGVTPGALYHHFASKSACLQALVAPYLDDLDELLTAAGRPPLPFDATESLLAGYLATMLRHRPVVRLVERDTAVGQDTLLGPRVEEITRRLQRLLAGDCADGDDVRASAALGALRRPVLRHDGELESMQPVLVAAALAALRSG